MNALPFAFHGHSAGAYLADIAMRGVIYSTINRVVRALTLTEVLVVCALAVGAFLMFSRRA